MGQRDRKTTAYVNDLGKTMPPQTGAQPEEQPVLNATGKVTFRLFICLSQWRPRLPQLMNLFSWELSSQMAASKHPGPQTYF